MNFDLKTTNWIRVDGLTDGTTYHMQAKQFNQNYEVADMLFTQLSGASPWELDDGILCTDVKLTKKENYNVYIRSNSAPVNIQVEEIA